MGVEKFVFHVGMAEHQIKEAIGRGLMGGGTEQSIDHAYMLLADSARSGLAYRKLTEFVHEAMRQGFTPRQPAVKPAAAEPVEAPVIEADKREAVDGHTGVYRKTHADGSVTYAAKWPHPDKPRASKTQSGFATVEEAEVFRNAQVNERIAA